MVPTALLASVVAALAAASPVKLAAPGFSYVNVDEKTGDFMVDYLAQQFVAQGIGVTTKTQINALLGFERQKALLGCSDQSASCLAELAGALGVYGLVTGSLARMAKGSYVVNITIVAARDGRSLAAMSARVPDDEALLDVLANAARELAAKVRSELGAKAAGPKPAVQLPMPPPPAGSSPRPATASAPAGRTAPGAPPQAVPAPEPALAIAEPPAAAQPLALPKWISLGVGGVAAVASGSLYGIAVAQRAGLDGTQPSVTTRAGLNGTLSSIGALQIAAAVSAGVAVLGFGGFGLGMILDRPPAVALAPTAGGSVVSVQWELP